MILTKKPSDFLLEYAPDLGISAEKHVRVRLISEDPFVAVGIESGSESQYLLVLPDKTLRNDVKFVNLQGVRSREMVLKDETSGSRIAKKCSSLNFRNFSKAAAILLDAIAETAIGEGDNEAVAELTEEFLELFKPQKDLSREELLGFFGELFIIQNSSTPEILANAWHKNERDRYDFASSNDRLEVKCTEGSRRHHSFSSTQLPAEASISLVVASVLTQEVSVGMSVVDLYESVILRLGHGSAALNVTTNFVQVFSRDEDMCIRTKFDCDQARKSLRLFLSESVPFVSLPPGVLNAKWTADLDKVSSLRDAPEGLSSAVNLC